MRPTRGIRAAIGGSIIKGHLRRTSTGNQDLSVEGRLSCLNPRGRCIRHHWRRGRVDGQSKGGTVRRERIVVDHHVVAARSRDRRACQYQGTVRGPGKIHMVGAPLIKIGRCPDNGDIECHRGSGIHRVGRRGRRLADNQTAGRYQPHVKDPIVGMTAAERDRSSCHRHQANLAPGIKIATGICQFLPSGNYSGSFPEGIRVNGIG